MTFSRERLGVTDSMLATYGELIFRMSHNLQQRTGDPVRLRDFAAVEAQREAMGLSDGQIAERLGLTREQVIFIRNLEESRRFRTGQQAYLIELGGGKRFRPERVVRLEDRPVYSEDAMRLRAAFAYDPQRVREFVERGWWRSDDVLGVWLARHVRERPDAAALVQGELTISYRDFGAKVARLAEGLRQAGIGKGDVVAVQLPNIAEFAVTFLAICRLGAVMCTMHMPYRDREVQGLLAHARAKAVVCLSRAKDWSPAQACLAMRGELPALKMVIALGEPIEGALQLQVLVERSGLLDERAVPMPVASDPFLLLYTSGTTSAPKAVPLNYHSMLSNARLSAPEHRVGAADRILSAAPFTHLFGLYALHVAWSVGATVTLLPAFTPPDLAAAVARDKPTGLWTAPAHLAALRAQKVFEPQGFSSLRLIIMSGSACPPELVAWYAERLPSCAVTQLFGMTEIQAALYTRPGDPPEVATRSAGRVSPGTEVRIRSTDGRTCAPGEEGALEVRGCLLFPGYFENAAASREAFTADGWFRTGDLARVDESGNVSITGRSKDLINRGGIKFNPRDVEDLLDAHPSILQSALVPMPDPVLGERACCFVTLRPGVGSLTLEEVVDYLARQRIAKTKMPERLVVVPEMPLTPTRKIIKSELKRRYVST
jgi:non-ribosomal peptide synthetase component E (peptide arylation enzyme)